MKGVMSTKEKIMDAAKLTAPDARKWSRAKRLEQLSEIILMHEAGLKGKQMY